MFLAKKLERSDQSPNNSMFDDSTLNNSSNLNEKQLLEKGYIKQGDVWYHKKYFEIRVTLMSWE